jgi:hypothetical protein
MGVRKIHSSRILLSLNLKLHMKYFFFKPAAFDWGPGTIAALDSSFFWGYLVTQVPGGYLAAKFPANKYLQFYLQSF